MTLSHFRKNAAADHKGGALFDPVTAADKGAEAVMREILARDFPDHGIIGEEFGAVNAGADYVWTLDPIDGTRAFILGLPLWGTLSAFSIRASLCSASWISPLSASGSGMMIAQPGIADPRVCSAAKRGRARASIRLF